MISCVRSVSFQGDQRTTLLLDDKEGIIQEYEMNSEFNFYVTSLNAESLLVGFIYSISIHVIVDGKS